MDSRPLLPAPASGRLAAPAYQYYRTASDSPSRQKSSHRIDDLISQLGPTTCVEALQSPSGALKGCMDAATIIEQAFAMRAAIASSSIQQWLDELSQWPWPESRGSAGFEEPASPSRPQMSTSGARTDSKTDTVGSPHTPGPKPQPEPAAPVTPERQITRTEDLLESPPDSTRESPAQRWMGSLPTGDVTRYDDRITEIRNEIDELEVEDLKRHVLHHYILPMSPPDTPSSDPPVSGASDSSSTASLSKMDDMTAVVSAIVLQALPQLSKLNSLMNTWHIRLLVLKKIPILLAALDAAETAIQSAWHAINLGGSRTSDLRRDEFDAMRSVVQQRVADAAQVTDYMLDSLDGREDTMPDEWIDRIDAAESKYTEWVSVCEHKVREAERKREREAAALLQKTAVLKELRTPERSRSIGSDGGDGDELRSPETHLLEPTLPNIPKTEQVERKEVFPDISVNSDETSPDDVLGIRSPTSSPPDFHSSVSRSAIGFGDMPTVAEVPSRESLQGTKTTPVEEATGGDEVANTSLGFEDDAQEGDQDGGEEPPDSGYSLSRASVATEDDQLQQQISEILESIPAKFQLSSQPSSAFSHLNPPDFKMPPRTKSVADNYSSSSNGNTVRSASGLSSRSGTPSFLLAPAFARTPRLRQQRSHQEIKLYHLSRSTGEAPIKLFVRLVGENGERVMVRVGGGWADLSEYLKEYASHHSRRSRSGGESRVEIRDLPSAGSMGPMSSPAVATPATARGLGSSPPSRPPSALDAPRAMTPLNVRKTRRSTGEEGTANTGMTRTPLAAVASAAETPQSTASTRSRSSSRVSWAEEDSTLGMSGPRAKNIEMSEESKAWVESVKEKVRMASGERKASSSSEQTDGKFGELGKVGGTKRLFRRAQ